MAKKRPNQQKLVDEFNEQYEVGQEVRYWTMLREGEGKVGRTRSAAQLLSGHTAVVWVEDHPACIALSHVEAIS
jgi:hypothetical protein